MQHVRNRFVPVALKAGSVNNPPRGIEGSIYQEINRTRAAPQGICVMNSAGRVLDWVLSFDSDRAMEQFFDHALERFQEFPANDRAFDTVRYRSFPSRKMPVIKDNGRSLEIPIRHRGDRCPGELFVPRGTLVGKIVGRPTDKENRLIDRTRHQEDYMEATFQISNSAQRDFLSALNNASEKHFLLPDSFVRSIVGPAYLGQLDVSPLIHVPTGVNRARWWEFFAERVQAANSRGDKSRDKTPTTFRVVGRSHLVGDGKQWNHRVSLDWQGYVDVRDDRIQTIEILGRGTERLQWYAGNLVLATQPACSTLMGGHPIDLDSRVVYGIRAETNRHD